MAEREMDDATRLVLEVVAKVLDSDDETPASLYPAWSANDGLYNPPSTSEVHRNVGGSRDKDQQLKYSGNPNANQVGGLDTRFTKTATSTPEVRKRYYAFCRREGDLTASRHTHTLYENGQVSCPVIRDSVCKICGLKVRTLSHCRCNTTWREVDPPSCSE